MQKILAIPRTQAPQLPLEGCWPSLNFSFIDPPQWRERAEVEHDEAWLQPIPYVVLTSPGADQKIWCYARQGGDARLDGRQSCGVGGHVDLIDAAPTAAQTLLSAAYRELVEELEIGADQLPPLMPCGLIYEGHSTIGRVHLGILMVATWPLAEPPKPRAGEALSSLGFFSPAEITGDPRFELWSRLAAGWVGEMLGGQ